ncbi:MAG: SDR family oxidoreductase [Pseudomonadota bacterium]
MKPEETEGKGRLAVVIGGASGIGAVTAQVLHDHGWNIAVADIDEAAAQASAARFGGHAVAMNVLEPSSIEAAAEEIEAAHGPVYAMVNFAAIFAPQTPPEHLPVETWDRISQVHGRGTYLTNVEFAKRMAAQGCGAIVNISSIAATRPNHGHAYVSGKAAINSLTESMAGEWGRSGVRVNAVTPGFVAVPRMVAAIKEGKRYPFPPHELTALGRLTEPKEVAEAIAFLLSDRASGITGANLAVDGGVLATSGWIVHGGVPKARPRAGAVKTGE